MNAAGITLSQGLLALHGNINFNTVVELRKTGDSLISQASMMNLRVDFSQVAHSDSSGLALITAWLRLANTLNKRLTLVNVPQSLLRIAKACNVSEFLDG